MGYPQISRTNGKNKEEPGTNYQRQRAADFFSVQRSAFMVQRFKPGPTHFPQKDDIGISASPPAKTPSSPRIY
jgi:hypothetical protein